MDTNTPHTETSWETAQAVANAVVEALAAANITRHAAADHAGIPRETFYRKCRGGAGIKPFDVEELARIAAVLGTTVTELTARAGRAA